MSPQPRATTCSRSFKYLLFIFCAGLCAANAPAQDGDGGRGAGSYWKAALTDGDYLVPHSAIASFALSRYVVDGALRVHEVSIDTIGSVQARFYFLEELLPQSPIGVGQSAIDNLRDKVREVQDRVGVAGVGKEVTKTHPLTTHAHTVEFILPDQESVQRLFRSLEDSWIKRRTVTFRLES
jgi:hypothetical protein